MLLDTSALGILDGVFLLHPHPFSFSLVTASLALCNMHARSMLVCRLSSTTTTPDSECPFCWYKYIYTSVVNNKKQAATCLCLRVCVVVYNHKLFHNHTSFLHKCRWQFFRNFLFAFYFQLKYSDNGQLRDIHWIDGWIDGCCCCFCWMVWRLDWLNGYMRNATAMPSMGIQ